MIAIDEYTEDANWWHVTRLRVEDGQGRVVKRWGLSPAIRVPKTGNRGQAISALRSEAAKAQAAKAQAAADAGRGSKPALIETIEGQLNE